jgi:hypothetical protein
MDATLSTCDALMPFSGDGTLVDNTAFIYNSAGNQEPVSRSLRFSRGGDRRSQSRKKNIGEVRFHRLRLYTCALVGAACHNSQTHTAGHPNVAKFPEPASDTSTSQTSLSRTADSKPDLNAPPEIYLEFALTMDLNAEPM